MGHGNGEQEYETIGPTSWLAKERGPLSAGPFSFRTVVAGQEAGPHHYSSSASNPAAVSCGAATAGTSSIRGGGGS
jgi:hypothetical protein